MRRELAHDQEVRRFPLKWSFIAALLFLLGIPTVGYGDGPTDAPSRSSQRDDDPERALVTPRPRRIRGPRVSRRVREERERDAQRYYDPVSDLGQNATGLYLGTNYVHVNGVRGVIEALRTTRTNAVVLDLKDGEGRVHHDTAVPELQQFKTGWLGDASAVVRELHENGIYVIARVTCFADRRLPSALPQRAIQHIRRQGRPWTSWGTGGTWLDPYNAENQAMVVALAREAEALGFDEVQLDYVRFPVDEGTQYARYPSETRQPRADVILGMLRTMDEALSIPIGVDVFGLSAYRRGDPSGLGQDLEAWTRHVEVYTPMLYINSMREWRVGEPNRAFSLVYDGTASLRERVGSRPVIRPFLQSFGRGAGQQYDANFISQQIRGVRRARADGFLFWHPGYNYGMVQRAMGNGGRRLVPFPISDRVRIVRRPPSMLPHWMRAMVGGHDPRSGHDPRDRRDARGDVRREPAARP